MNKDITDYNYEELIDHCTGEAIMSLGKGVNGTFNVLFRAK